MIQRLVIFSEMHPAAVIPLISSRRKHERRGRINQPGYRLAFNEVYSEGIYKVEAGKIVSPYSRTKIRIKNDATDIIC